MTNNSFKVSNTRVFLVFAISTIIIIGLFVFFFLRFNGLDDNEYSITLGSMFYNDDYNYINVEKKSYLSQKFDGNYYLYQKDDGKTLKEKVGKNPVIFNKNDYKVYLYGTSYEIKSSGEVVTLDGMNEIIKTSPTKFYKLQDRKYLMVDSSLRTSDNLIKTTGYLIIELDKQGNATFANNELNIKTIKPLILKGTTMNFDIANEKLIYGKKEINLKNVMGSTNKYNSDSNKNKDKDKSTNLENSSSSSNSGDNDSYYDDYLKNVIYSVNNLTNSVTEVNDKSDNSIKKGEIYYDFSKYIALKSVESSVTTISVNYAVVDANNEYQNVFIVLDDNNGNVSKYFVNKNEIVYTIRDLIIDHNYTLSFGYRLVGSEDEVIEDVVNIKTKIPSCAISLRRLSNTSLTYNVKIGSDYKFDSGTMSLFVLNGAALASAPVDMDKAVSDDGFTGKLTYNNLGEINVLRLENLVYNGNSISLDCSYRFKR